MTESLEIIVEMIAIVSFVATVVNYTIIKPLRISIDTLTLAVEKLEKLLHKVEDDEQKLHTDVSLIEKQVEFNKQEIKRAFGRIEHLEEYHKTPLGGKYS